jgi:hypothetical protein
MSIWESASSSTQTSMNPSMFMGAIRVESKFEILIQNGEIKGIHSKTVRGRKTLDRVQQQLLQEFVEAYAEQIVQRWIDYFVYNREIATEIINQRVK